MILNEKTINQSEEQFTEIPTGWEEGYSEFTFSYDTSHTYKLNYSFGGGPGDDGLSSRQVYPTNELPNDIFTVNINEEELTITITDKNSYGLHYVAVLKSIVPNSGLIIKSSSISTPLPTSISNTLTIDSTASVLEISGNEITCSYKNVDKNIIYEGDFQSFWNTPQERTEYPNWSTTSGGTIRFSKQSLLPQSKLVLGLSNIEAYTYDSYTWTTAELLQGREAWDWTFEIYEDPENNEYWILSAEKNASNNFNLGQKLIIIDPYFCYKKQYKIKTNQTLWAQDHRISDNWTLSSDIANYSFVNGILTVLWKYTDEDGDVTDSIPDTAAYDTWLQLYSDLNNYAQIRVSGNAEELVIDSNVNVTGSLVARDLSLSSGIITTNMIELPAGSALENYALVYIPGNTYNPTFGTPNETFETVVYILAYFNGGPTSES